MNIGNVGLSGARYTAAMATAAQAEEAVSNQQENAAAESTVNRDTFERTQPEQSVTYSKNKLNKAQADQLMAAEENRTQSFMNMLKSMIVKQGQQSNLTLFGMDLFVTPEQSAKAAASIAEGGEYSVDAVAGRIMDMAKALSGGDASKIEELREAVEKGFKAAGVELGGKLPSISQQTHTEVMKRFDEWAAEAKKASSASGEA